MKASDSSPHNGNIDTAAYRIQADSPEKICFQFTLQLVSKSPPHIPLNCVYLTINGVGLH